MRSPLRSWPVWQLPRWLAACVTAVIAAYAAAAAGALASTPLRPGDLRLCAVFVGCGVASVEPSALSAVQSAGFLLVRTLSSTNRPTIWWAWWNGVPARARASARSVATTQLSSAAA